MSKFMMLSFNNFIIWYWLASLDRTFADGIATGGRLAKIAVVHELSGGFPTDVIEHVFETRIPSLNLEILSLYINGTRDLDDSELFDAGRLLRGRNDVLAVVGPSNSNDVTLFHPHAVLMDIPHIVPMATDPIFDGMDRFPMLIRMTPGYNYQIDAFLDLVTQLNWTSLAIISSESDYAHHAGERFRQSAEGRGVKVLLNRRLGDLSGDLRIGKHLSDIKRSGQKITMLICDRSLASQVLREAEKADMTGEGWGWILWNDILDRCPHEHLATTDNGRDRACTPKIPGLLAIRTTLQAGSVYEQLRLETEHNLKTLEEMKYAEAILAAAYGIDSFFKQTKGEERTLLQHILSPYGGLNKSLDGVMGRVELDAKRRVAMYDVMFDVVNLGADGEWKTIGQWSAIGNRSRLDLDENKLVLPGRATKIAAYLPLLEYQELAVITMEAVPFVEIDQGSRWQATASRNKAAYSGYCIELLEKLSSELGFKYTITHLGAGGKFGMRDPVSGYWNGLIGKLVSGKADLALAPITVTEERAIVVDFISPFMKTDLKFALNRDAVTNRGDGSNKYGRFSFLQPFSSDLWAAIVLTALLMAFYLALVSRLSPYGAHGRYFQSDRGAESSTRMARRRSSVMMLTSQQARRRRSSLALPPQESSLGFGGSLSEGDESGRDLARSPSNNVKVSRRVSFSDQTGRRGVMRRKSSVTFDRSLLPSRHDISSTDEQDSDESEEQERRTARRFMSINNALYFACAGLLWQSPECVPRSPSARVAASIWYMVGVIIVASYTANMVAFVTQTSATTSVRTVTDLLDQKIIPPATVASSSVDSLLMTSSLDVASRLYKEILRNPSLSLQPNESSALAMADSGRVAFVWEGVPLDHYAFTKSDCRTTTIPLGFGRASYALALRRGSHFTEVFNRQILRLRQSGYLEELRMKYFQESCEDKNLAEKDEDGSTYVQLTFSSLSGVFIMISVAAALSIVILVMEWIIASLSDIDRTDPKRPSDFQSSISIRFRRLREDFQNNWLPFKNIREHWSKFRPAVYPTYRRDATDTQVQPDQWKRYVATPGCEKLTRGHSISNPDLRLEETDDDL